MLRKTSKQFLFIHFCFFSILEGCYVFQTALNCNRTYLAASSSNNDIKIYDPETFSFISQLEGHTATINEIKFSCTNPSVLFSCSSDGTLRIWDIRSSSKGPVYRGQEEFWSFDVNSNETHLASGNKGTVFMWYKLEDQNNISIFLTISFLSKGTSGRQKLYTNMKIFMQMISRKCVSIQPQIHTSSRPLKMELSASLTPT